MVNSSGKKDMQNRRRWLTRRFNAGLDLLQQELYLPILENGCVTSDTLPAILQRMVVLL